MYSCRKKDWVILPSDIAALVQVTVDGTTVYKVVREWGGWREVFFFSFRFIDS